MCVCVCVFMNVCVYNALCECRGYRNDTFSMTYGMKSPKYLYIDTVICKLRMKAEEKIEH